MRLLLSRPAMLNSLVFSSGIPARLSRHCAVWNSALRFD